MTEFTILIVKLMDLEQWN